MRPKVVVLLLLAGLAGFAVIFVLKPKPTPPRPVATPVAQTEVAVQKTNPVVPPPAPLTNKTVAAVPAGHNPSPFITPQVEGDNAEFLQKQIDRLDELEMNDDDASFQAIMKELTNTNQLIRHEAIEASIQFGNRKAIPILQDLAARTTDPDEKKELLDAADFMALPTMTEVMAQKRAEKLQGTAPAK